MRFLLLLLLAASASAADAPTWTVVSGGAFPDHFKSKRGSWFSVGDAKLDGKNPRLLQGVVGKGAWLNGPKGREPDIYTKESFGDLEVEFEFMLGKGSNSGVKFHGLYEIQLCDSFGKKGTLTGHDCGGIYPTADLLPVYKHRDKGIGPKANACKAPGEWQSLHAVFRAPRFDKEGKKTANARLVRATLNGTVIHEDVELKTPTGHNWTKKEMEKGPLMLQGDHGPVAFRNVKLRLPAAK